MFEPIARDIYESAHKPRNTGFYRAEAVTDYPAGDCVVALGSSGGSGGSDSVALALRVTSLPWCEQLAPIHLELVVVPRWNIDVGKHPQKQAACA